MRGGRVRLDGTRILFYHRVAEARDQLAVRPEDFKEQMATLAELGLRGLDIAQLVPLLASGGADSSVVGISFDDGYLDIADNALPILAHLGFSASVFVSTAVTSGTASFSWYARQPPLMPWTLIKSLDDGKTFRFEAHTRTHPNLVRVDEERAREEIAGGKAELEERLGRSVDIFCYPAGVFAARERALVEQAGFRAAVSCEPGVNTVETDRFALKRIQIDHRDSLLDFRAKVLGGHDSPPLTRTVYRRLRFGSNFS